jgi:hypothetical protein
MYAPSHECVCGGESVAATVRDEAIRRKRYGVLRQVRWGVPLRSTRRLALYFGSTFGSAKMRAIWSRVGFC